MKILNDADRIEDLEFLDEKYYVKTEQKRKEK